MRANAILHLYSWGVTFGWGSSRVTMLRGLNPSPLHPKLEDFHRVPVAPSATLRNHRWCLCERTWKSWMIRISSYNPVFWEHFIGYIWIDVSTALGSPQSLNTMGQLVFFQICNKNDIPSWCPVGWTPQWISWQSHPKDHLPNPS